MKALCQRGRATCGACCGLYNARSGRGAVWQRLRRRTEVLARTPCIPDAFREAADALDAEEPEPIFPSIRVCPLLGFLDPEETRIGCLGHPQSTGGPDLRGCGAYEPGICESFFCASHQVLTGAEAALLAESCGRDPYLYGLVVSDARYARACLAAVAERLGRPLGRRQLHEPRFARALRELLAMKEELTPGSDGIYGAFRPGGEGEAHRPGSNAETAGRQSPAMTILGCMGADARSGNDPEALQAESERRLDACAAAAGIP